MATPDQDHPATRPARRPRSRRSARLWCLALPVLLAGAGSPPPSAPPPTGGTVSIETAPDEGSDDAGTQMFVDAASRLLSERDFTLLDGVGHAAYVMRLRYRRSTVGTGSGRTPTGDPDLINGGTNAGVGSVLKVPLPTRKSQLVALERTQLDMRLVRRGEDTPLWHGTAVTVRPAGERASVATTLSAALLRAYPAQPQATIGVP